MSNRRQRLSRQSALASGTDAGRSAGGETHDYTTFASYADGATSDAALRRLGKRSKAVAAAPRFDFAVMDAYLDSEPPLASVFVKIRSYVKGLTAPFAGEGPAIDTSVTGG